MYLVEERATQQQRTQQHAIAEHNTSTTVRIHHHHHHHHHRYNTKLLNLLTFPACNDKPTTLVKVQSSTQMLCFRKNVTPLK
jgi:hypothetical protein